MTCSVWFNCKLDDEASGSVLPGGSMSAMHTLHAGWLDGINTGHEGPQPSPVTMFPWKPQSTLGNEAESEGKAKSLAGE